MNKKIFGFDCPGCGMQRAAHLLFQGDFVGAFKMYPAIYPIMLLLIFLISTFFVKIKYAPQIKLILMLLTAGTIIISYVIKMSTIIN